MDDFVNLHLHTEASLQDSVIRVPDLIKRVKKYGQSAVAVTDHSSVASWVELNRECEGTNIKAIFGNEFYCSKTYEEKSKNRDHLVLLAMNCDGIVTLSVTTMSILPQGAGAGQAFFLRICLITSAHFIQRSKTYEVDQPFLSCYRLEIIHHIPHRIWSFVFFHMVRHFHSINDTPYHRRSPRVYFN